MTYKEAWDILKRQLIEQADRRNRFNKQCIDAGIVDFPGPDAPKIELLFNVIETMGRIERIIKFENKYKGDTFDV